MSDLVSLSKFTEMLKDTCRPNRFFVTIVGDPAGVQWLPEPYSFMVKSFVIPDFNVGEIVLNYAGMQHKLQGDLTISDCSMTLHVDNDMKILDFFERWLEGIITVGVDGENVRLSPQECAAEIRVQQLDRTGKTVKTYMLQNAWPKSKSTIELNHDNTDTPMDMTVDFAIDYYYILGSGSV